jgi:hypothetical protein
MASYCRKHGSSSLNVAGAVFLDMTGERVGLEGRGNLFAASAYCLFLQYG